MSTNGCGHVCHTRGLNPWVPVCPVCGCDNANYDAVNAERLKEQFILEMEAMGWTGFRENLDFLKSIRIL